MAATPELLEEHFGPVVLFLRYGSRDDLLAALSRIDGPAHRHAARAARAEDVAALVDALRSRAGA